MGLFLSFEHFDTTGGLLLGLISILLCPGTMEARREMRERLVEQANTHTTQHILSSLSYIGMVHDTPKQLR